MRAGLFKVLDMTQSRQFLISIVNHLTQFTYGFYCENTAIERSFYGVFTYSLISICVIRNISIRLSVFTIPILFLYL